MFIYIFLISCFGLLNQQAWLSTTNTIIILVVYRPVVFSKPKSLVGSVLKEWFGKKLNIYEVILKETPFRKRNSRN